MDDMFKAFNSFLKDRPGFINEMGMELTEIKECYAKGKIKIHEKHLNPMGTVHGGLIFGLCDTIGGIAAMTTGSTVVTLNSSICYLNPAGNTDYIEAEATAVKDGRTTTIYDVIIRTAEGIDVAKTTITYYKNGLIKQ